MTEAPGTEDGPAGAGVRRRSVARRRRALLAVSLTVLIASAGAAQDLLVERPGALVRVESLALAGLLNLPDAGLQALAVADTSVSIRSEGNRDVRGVFELGATVGAQTVADVAPPMSGSTSPVFG